MFRKSLLLISLAIPLAVPAHAEPTGSSDAAASEKLVCRTTQKTGSYFRQRVCHTKAEWDAMQATSNSDLDRTRAMERSRSTVGVNR